MRVREPRRLEDLRLRSVGPPVRDVLPHRAAEEDGVLQHETDLVADALQLVIADVDAVDQDAAGGRIVEARDEAHHRRFSRSGGAHDADELARADGEAHALQHRARGIVREGDAIELDRSLEPSGLYGIRPFRDAHVDVENAADPFHADRGLRDRARHLGEVLHRLEELVQVGKEDGQRPGRHRGGEDERCSPPENERGAERHGHHDHRREQ